MLPQILLAAEFPFCFGIHRQPLQTQYRIDRMIAQKLRNTFPPSLAQTDEAGTGTNQDLSAHLPCP
jgi:hypothetical protein